MDIKDDNYANLLSEAENALKIMGRPEEGMIPPRTRKTLRQDKRN